MPESAKVTVLLANEDTLHRDGLWAVLGANTEVDVVFRCEDGYVALDGIRELRPDVAIVDLNLACLSGIEIVRRVRGERLGTRIIVLSGSETEPELAEIVREAMLAGADGFLLKDGPARHLTEAINSVRDGGRYFSPKLALDGGDWDGRDWQPPEDTPVTVSDPVTETWPLKERRALARIAGPRRFEERIREETRDLPDRDYEILAKMATGIRPILDRLDEIEGRIAEMEEGEEPLPADPRGWLNAELADTIAGAAGARRLPRSIEEAVAKRFQSMAGKLQEEIEQQHVRALETFVGNIQLKLVRRVSALEQNMRQQTEAMHELREYNQRTDDNLNRLISGVDKLAKRLVRRAEPAEPEVQRTGKGSRVPITPGRSSLKPGIFWSVVAVVIVLAGVYKFHSPRKAISPAAEKQGQTASGAAGVSLFGADIKTKLEAAGQDKDRKEYRSAEEVYKQVLRAEPGNEDALTGLASVLYREDKLEESAAVLERLPKN